MRRFYAQPDNFSSDRVLLDADETKHLRDVLRLRAGDEVQVFDGNGQEFSCEIEKVLKNSTELKVLGEIEPTAPESSLEITLTAAVLKGEKFDLVVQKAVELGVSQLVPLQTIRCDVKIKDADKRFARWNKIALESTKQSGRAKLISISALVDLKQFLKTSDAQNTVLFSERDGDKFEILKSKNKITAIVGPEGGWDDSELNLARESGVKIVTLGGRILRAETASIAITAILQHRFGDLN